MIKNFTSLGTPDFCSEISGIPFVPVDLPTGGHTLLRFCDACLPVDRVLVWNAMPCLKPEFKLNDVMRERFKVATRQHAYMGACVHAYVPMTFWQVVSPPPSSMVVANMRSITVDVLNEWPLEESVTSVFQKIFDYLWARCAFVRRRHARACS